MGLLMQWALLVLVSWAQLFVGELKGLALSTPVSWSTVSPCLSWPGHGHMVPRQPLCVRAINVGWLWSQPCRASTLPWKARQDMNLRSTHGTAEPLLGEVSLAGWQAGWAGACHAAAALQSPC